MENEEHVIKCHCGEENIVTNNQILGFGDIQCHECGDLFDCSELFEMFIDIN